MPEERNIKVSAAGDSLVLFGMVPMRSRRTGPLRWRMLMCVLPPGVQGGPQRTAWGAGGGSKGSQGITGREPGRQRGWRIPRGRQGNTQVINLLQVGSNQQVMLEVKIAEINRTVAEKLGFDFQRAARKAGSAWTQIMTGIIGGRRATVPVFEYAWYR